MQYIAQRGAKLFLVYNHCKDFESIVRSKMPLILVAGRPCTGKTTIAAQIKQHYESEGIFEEVILINEEGLSLSKTTSYSTANHEKALRGALKSGMEHALVKPNRLVILDALNYIKGYRYEIYCTTRTARTPHSVVWVTATEDEAKSRNTQRREEGGNSYEDAILQDLWKRFEAPNDANRWDNPLFKVKNTAAEHATSPTDAAPSSTDIAVETVIQPKSLKSSWKPKKKKATDGSDAAAEAKTADAAPSSSSAAAAASSSSSSASTTDDASSVSHNTLSISGTKVTDGDDLSQFVELATVFPALTDYLLHANLPLPNSSTVAAAHAQADLLYELDRTSQRITQMIMAHQADALEGTPLKFTDYDRVLTLNRLISPGELQRYRSQFVKVHSQHPPTTSVAVGVSFIELLGLHL